MTPTNKYNAILLDALRSEKIICSDRGDGTIAVNRTSCHMAPLFSNSQEWDIIDFLPVFLRDAINQTGVDSSEYYLSTFGKTDDDWFFATYDMTNK